MVTDITSRSLTVTSRLGHWFRHHTCASSDGMLVCVRRWKNRAVLRKFDRQQNAGEAREKRTMSCIIYGLFSNIDTLLS